MGKGNKRVETVWVAGGWEKGINVLRQSVFSFNHRVSFLKLHFPRKKHQPKTTSVGLAYWLWVIPPENPG